MCRAFGVHFFGPPCSVYAKARIRVCYANSVRPSVTPSRVLCVKKAKRIIEILSPSDRPIILVFRHQGLLRKSYGFTPNRGATYKGVPIFDQYAAISETVIDRSIVTIEDEYKVECALSNGATFDDLE